MMHKVARVRFGLWDRLRLLFGGWVVVSVEGPVIGVVLPRVELEVEPRAR
jgi:hypothetical protein